MGRMNVIRVAVLPLLCWVLISIGARVYAGPGVGTRIVVTKTAFARVERLEKYSWTLSESLQVPNQVTLVIPQGQSTVVGFNLVATRSGPEVLTSDALVNGEICVTNTGSQPTQGLRIRDQLEREVSPGVWQMVVRTSIPLRYELRAGARRCFPYQFEEPLDSEAQYRNKAVVTIDNFLGFEGEPRSVTAVAPVEWIVSSTTVDATASVSDPFFCPSGMDCELGGTVTQVSDSVTVPFSVRLTNISAPCGQTLTAYDVGTLVPSDTQVEISSYASVGVYTGSCSQK